MGSVVISIDAELGWGHHDLADPPRHRVERARTGWIQLHELLERFEIPATWAVVGHLLLDSCDGRHADHPAPDDWFARERGEWRDRPDLRFGPGLVRSVEEASVDHELACHSFSHVEFGAPETTRELAAAEVRASLEAARKRGLDMETFVFPRNRLGHLDVLAEHDFTCYRGPSVVERADSTVTRQAVRAARGGGLADSLLLVEPERDEYGLVNVPASLYLYSFEGTLRRVCEPAVGDPIVRQARRGIDLAAEREGVFHMWLHPNNLHSEYAVDRLREVLAHLQQRRDETDLAVETMAAVAARARREAVGDGEAGARPVGK